MERMATPPSFREIVTIERPDSLRKDNACRFAKLTASGKGGGIYDSYLRLARPAVPCLGKPHATPDNRGRRAHGEEARRPSRRLGQFRRQRPGRTYQSSVKPPTQRRVGPIKPPKRQLRFSAWVVLPVQQSSAGKPAPGRDNRIRRNNVPEVGNFNPLAGLKELLLGLFWWSRAHAHP
jgi:hypothetical protein